MLKRSVLVAATLFAATAYLAHASRAEAVPTRRPLTSFPMRLGMFEGRRSADFDPRVMAVLGVDEFVNRIYESGAGPIGLYIGYYQSQRQGDAIHSPLNCLPGAGWQPVDRARVTVDVAGHVRRAPIEINRIVIEKGDERQVAFYWYQSRGRVEASEYWSKFHLIADAIRLNRTDAALVRVIVPIARQDMSAERAEDRGLEFIRTMFPLLGSYLPD